MRDHPQLHPQTPKPTPHLLRCMDRIGVKDAHTDTMAGDHHLFQMMGRIYQSGRTHREAWERYRQAYEAEMARLQDGDRTGAVC